MLCLELMTGAQPFKNRERDIQVALDLREGKLPERPGEPAVSRGLSDSFWIVMLQCWDKNPEMRPSMTRIKEMLKSLPPLSARRREF
jgi:son of sevenless-like protein